MLSDKLFAELDICEETQNGIRDMGFEFMSLIQAKTVGPLLAGRDLLAQARTGSGKTLAFLIPSIELLHKGHFAQRNGTGVIVLSPTRYVVLILQSASVCVLCGSSSIEPSRQPGSRPSGQPGSWILDACLNHFPDCHRSALKPAIEGFVATLFSRKGHAQATPRTHGVVVCSFLVLAFCFSVLLCWYIM